mgnify:FL=1
MSNSNYGYKSIKSKYEKLLVDLDNKVKEGSSDNLKEFEKNSKDNESNLQIEVNISVKNFLMDIIYNNYELHDVEVQILRLLGVWNRVMSKTIKSLEPNLIINYIIKIATALHSLWNTKNYRILDEKNVNLSVSRLILLKSIQYVLRSGFKVLNVKPMEIM